MAPCYLHPALVLLTQIFASSLALAKTRPTSWLRLATVPFLLRCIYVARYYARDVLRPSFAGLLAGCNVIFFLQYLDVALLSATETALEAQARMKASSNARNQSSGTSQPRQRSEPANPESHDSTLVDGLSALLNLRHINTPSQVKNVPPHSHNDLSSTPNTTTFLARNVLSAVISHLLIDLIQQAPPAPKGTFAATKIPVFARLYSGALSPTSSAFRSEILQRAQITLGFWLTLYLWLILIGSLCNISCVLSSLSTPSDCRPFFGPLTSAYSVRNYWGRFWHQCLRRFLTRDVQGVSRGWLGMRPGVVRRYGELVGCFALSGLMHEVPNGIAKGVELWDMSGWTALRFFVTQGVGICVEDVVVWVWRRVVGEEAKRAEGSGRRDKGGMKIWQRGLGYVWVVVFLVWSTPMWIFPTADAKGVDDPGLLLGSVFKALRGRG